MENSNDWGKKNATPQSESGTMRTMPTPMQHGDGKNLCPVEPDLSVLRNSIRNQFASAPLVASI